MPDAHPRPDAHAAPDAMPATVGPVTGLTATPGVTAGTVDLAWTNPSGAGFADVIVVRRLAAAEVAAPVDGSTYAASDTLGAGDVVVYAGSGTSFQDTALPPGMIHYAAFARSTSSVWATPASRAHALVAAVAQTATITVAFTPVGATVTQQPANYTLAATATWDDPTDTLTVHVDATSGYARIVFAPKVEVTSATQGTITGDGTLATFPFVRLSPSIPPAGTAGADFVFTGVDGTVNPVLINLTLVDNPMGIVFPRYEQTSAFELIDPATMTSIIDVPCDGLVYVDSTNGECGYQAGAISPNGDVMFTGARSLPVVRKVDLGSGTVTGTLALDAGIGAVRQVVLSPDGSTLYALLLIGGHLYTSGNVQGNEAANEDGVLVKIDPVTLTETSRLVLVSQAAQTTSRLMGLALSPDGTRIAVAEKTNTAATVYFVDAATMTQVDTDSVTAGVQPLDLSATITTFNLKEVAYDSTGANLFVLPVDPTTVAKIDAATFAVTGITMTGMQADSGDLIAGAGGKMYVTASDNPNGLSMIDGNTVTPAIGAFRGATGILGNRLFVATHGGTLAVFDATTLAEDAGDGGALVLSPGHYIAFTPF